MSEHSLTWCFSTLGCHKEDLAGIAAIAHRHEISTIELRGVAGRFDMVDYLASAGYTPSGLAAWFQSAALSLASLDASGKLLGATDAHRAELLAFAPWADALGAPGIRIFDGGRFEDEPTDEELGEGARLLDWWEDQKRLHGWSVDLFIETHDALCLTERLQRFVALSAAPVHLIWDTHHTWKRGREDPLDTWEALAPLVRHVHLKDSLAKPTPNGSHPYTLVNLGDGEFPFDPILERLQADRFRGPVSLEWERAWHPYLDPIDAPLERLARWRR